ncbi:hypothetical protein [Nesterenkonia aerolata]|uniref:Uncharacterized protein n=1 Tax=Nesterenkonia aerolata TaxID=3074079 RepID=A0ABU2DR97_9MICC|nr:hypothetical protein [Nesterenkonia sp. LY-0111]MDR8018926.1 hypothetical protein [Nesterenkonia sp. LY-0111]
MSRTMKRAAAAGIFAASAMVASLLAAPASAAPEENAPAEGETCYETRDFRWSSNSYLYPGVGNVERDPKIIDEGGDVSIDGWSSRGNGAIHR